MFKLRSEGWERVGAGSSDRVPLLFTFINQKRRYWPGRGLLYSLLVHEIIFVVTLIFPVSAKPMPRTHELDRYIMMDLRDPVLYLPVLNDPDTAMSASEESDGESKTEAPPPSPKGLSYPGPQPILSNFPEPTNRIQTVLQPSLQNPPILKPPLLLPNIVQMAESGGVPRFAPPVPDVQPAQSVTPPPPTPVEPPPVQPEVKPAAPAAPPVPAPAPQIIEVAKVLPPPVVNKPPEPAPAKDPLPPTPQTENATVPSENINSQQPTQKPVEEFLALSPMPAPIDRPVQLPLGEARGQFAISPQPNLVASDAEPGIGTKPIASGAIKNSVGPNTGNASSSGAGASASPDSRTGSAGAGKSAGAPKGPFSGITILGGGTVKGGSAGPTISIAGDAIPPQTSYGGITVISTESSGGGLPRLGVFSNEQIYTVYLDMRRSTADRSPSWTFQYALHERAPGEANGDNAIRTQQGLILPFPIVREPPVLPAEIVSKYLRRLVIVYAIITVDGKMDQISVKETPDAALIEPIQTALTKWTFRPANLGGRAVPMKVLFGIPLHLP